MFVFFLISLFEYKRNEHSRKHHQEFKNKKKNKNPVRALFRLSIFIFMHLFDMKTCSMGNVNGHVSCLVVLFHICVCVCVYVYGVFRIGLHQELIFFLLFLCVGGGEKQKGRQAVRLGINTLSMKHSLQVLSALYSSFVLLFS